MESGPEVWQGLVHTIPIGCDAGRSGLCTPGGEGEDKGETFGKRKCPKLPPLGASPSEHRGCARLQPHNACRSAPNRCHVCVQGPGARAEPCSAFPGLVQGEAQHTAPAYRPKVLRPKGSQTRPACRRLSPVVSGMEAPCWASTAQRAAGWGGGVLSCQ